MSEYFVCLSICHDPALCWNGWTIIEMLPPPDYHNNLVDTACIAEHFYSTTITLHFAYYFRKPRKMIIQVDHPKWVSAPNQTQS